MTPHAAVLEKYCSITLNASEDRRKRGAEYSVAVLVAPRVLESNRVPELNSVSVADNPRHTGRPRRGRWTPNGFHAVDDLVPNAPVSRATLFRDIAAGRLESIRWRNRVLVSEPAWRAWLAAVPSSAADAAKDGEND
jgi:hypothetical protein